MANTVRFDFHLVPNERFLNSNNLSESHHHGRPTEFSGLGVGLTLKIVGLSRLRLRDL